ncbi:hypothetical protein IU469_06285 [Nocardia puris]|uniref:hypothetical protein n=1 Tax=Nocardia puris TaxID=208602 RepID=UPI001893C3A4|nr:hypothetical protein [Nocardia puris]MBF6214177.1 hypothetical protein [Nocardia puris]MBF6365333.1 hypothetical protein [Nocardia puris]
MLTDNIRRGAVRVAMAGALIAVPLATLAATASADPAATDPAETVTIHLEEGAEVTRPGEPGFDRTRPAIPARPGEGPRVEFRQFPPDQGEGPRVRFREFREPAFPLPATGSAGSS